MSGVILQGITRNALEPKSTTDYIFKVTSGVVTATTLTSYLDSLELKANTTLSSLNAHKNNNQNPHSVTKAQVGLSNVDNTSDINKPISTATQTALDKKANKTDLATVATSGSYNDLTDKPNIPETIITEEDLAVYAKKTDLPTKTSQLTNDSKYQTQAQVQTLINTRQPVINGGTGEVAYASTSGVFTQQILSKGMVTISNDEVTQCSNTSPSMQSVFNTWKMFSHLNGTDNASQDDMNAWSFNSEKNTIQNSRNTDSYTGYVSPNTYSNYDITVRLYSTHEDDDTLGLVAAFATDSNGKQHTLSFLRTPWANTGTVKWCCKVDHCTFYPANTAYNQIILVDKTSAITVPTASAGWNSATIGIGTVVNMTRQGNIITAKCSQFNSTTLDPNTLITIDLDALSTQYPVLNNFKGSSSWGYGAMSQPYAMYENINVSDPSGHIYDTTNNRVLQYNSNTKSWDVVSGVTPVQQVGAGRFSFNEVTKKLFYCDGNQIIQVGGV